MVALAVAAPRQAGGGAFRGDRDTAPFIELRATGMYALAKHRGCIPKSVCFPVCDFAGFLNVNERGP